MGLQLRASGAASPPLRPRDLLSQKAERAFLLRQGGAMH